MVTEPSRCKNSKPLTKKSSRRWIPTKTARLPSRRYRPSCEGRGNRVRRSTNTSNDFRRPRFDVVKAVVTHLALLQCPSRGNLPPPLVCRYRPLGLAQWLGCEANL